MRLLDNYTFPGASIVANDGKMSVPQNYLHYLLIFPGKRFDYHSKALKLADVPSASVKKLSCSNRCDSEPIPKCSPGIYHKSLLKKHRRTVRVEQVTAALFLVLAVFVSYFAKHCLSYGLPSINTSILFCVSTRHQSPLPYIQVCSYHYSSRLVHKCNIVFYTMAVSGFPGKGRDALILPAPLVSEGDMPAAPIYYCIFLSFLFNSFGW